MSDERHFNKGTDTAKTTNDAIASEIDAMTERVKQDKANALRPRVIWPVIRAAGLVPWAIAFAGLFLMASLIVDISEPRVEGFGNAAWLMFQVVTTIGLGDFTCTSITGRICTVVLSVYSVFFLALVTGAMVTYCSERMALRRNKSVAHFIGQLEHLDDLSQEELRDLSEKIKRIGKRFY